MLAGSRDSRRGSVIEIEVGDPRRRCLDHHEGAYQLRIVEEVLAFKVRVLLLTELRHEGHTGYTGL